MKILLCLYFSFVLLLMTGCVSYEHYVDGIEKSAKNIKYTGSDNVGKQAPNKELENKE